MRIRQRLDTLTGHKDFPAALSIVEKLNELGFQAVMAGGCVRDGLLGRQPKDIDVATSAKPDDVEQAFAHTLAVGKAFGTIVVVIENRSFEVTTFRRDGDYTDGRHPGQVEFSNMEEDAKRRDFTVNALFYDPLKQEIMDYVGGIRDLRSRVLQTVGVAEMRFSEDHLRMLRAVRFVAQLGFDLEAKTAAAMRLKAADVGKVSAERILGEIKRLLESGHLIQGLKVFKSTGLVDQVWPEVSGLDLKKLEKFPLFLHWENAFAAMMLLVEAQDPVARLKSWKASNETVRKVRMQIQGFNVLADEGSKRADRARVLGGEFFAEVLLLAQGLVRGREGRQRVQNWVHEFLTLAGKTGQLPQPLVNGQDLLSQGIEPGGKMGLILKALYDAQLEGRVSTKAEALAEVSRLKLKV